MSNTYKYFSTALLGQGIILAGMGLYFIFIRPPLLPEDLSYIKTELDIINASVPGIFTWLDKVFIVMGGYILSTGLLMSYIAITFDGRPNYLKVAIVFLSVLFSIVLMTVINFILDSNFKWLLCMFNVPWLISLVSYSFQLNSNRIDNV